MRLRAVSAGERERSQVAHQVIELTKQPDPTGCWK